MKLPPRLMVLAWTAVCSSLLSAGNPNDKLRTFEKAALTTPGDPTKGKLLFQDDQRTKCAVCHKVSGQGGGLGPDLSSIGGKFDRPHLIESLLLPSSQIVEGYRSSAVLTVDGKIVTGVIKQRDDVQITLVDADVKQHLIPSDLVERISEQSVSIMPTGLVDALSAVEFTDLVAYLETLRPDGNFGAGSNIIGPVALPEGFDLRTIATGLTGATAIEVLPDGRVLVCEQTGSLRIIKDGKLLEQPALMLPVNHEWERGVIGVTIDPNFAASPWVYVCWIGKEPYPHHRVSRFRLEGDVLLPESQELLLVGDDQTKLGGNVPAGHQGGAIHFGIDGKLFIGIGEQTAGQPSQHLDTFLGKILRINSDGSLPMDNPLLDQTTGKYQAIWAYGLRNPFTFAIRPQDGLMLINDVGGNFEEINVGMAGKNYGWPTIPHGPAHRDGFEDPIHWYPEASISGGDFLPKDVGWPKEYQGRYFFADFKHGWIHTIDPNANENTSESGINSKPFAAGLRRPVDIRFSPDGSLLVLLRNAWVIDGKFQAGTSSLLAIYPK